MDERTRITVYLDDDEMASLDELKAHIRRTERRRVDRSELIRAAVRLYRQVRMDARDAGPVPAEPAR